MKKFGIIAAVIFMSVALIVPAMAIELDATGNFRIRGFMRSNGDSNLNENIGTNSFYDFRLRSDITATVNDKVKLNARVDIGDETLGGTDGVKDPSAEWDYAWMTLITDYGKFDIGRMKGGCFGLGVFDSEVAKDRFKWTMPAGDMTYLGVVEKNAELDYNSTASDADSDAYYAIGIYKKDNITAGLLAAYVRSATDTTYQLTQQVLIPYWDIKIDDTYGVKGEIYYRPGKKEYENSADDVDLSGMGFYIAGTGNFGKTTVEVGLAYASGDDETTGEDESLRATGAGGGYNAGLGDEWAPFAILQFPHYVLNSAGDGDDGVTLIYAQARYALSEDMTVTGVIGMANAVETADDVDDSYGIEIDANLEWKLTDALTYNFNLGYLMAGDYFTDSIGIEGTEAEDMFSLYHTLQLDF